MKVDKKLLLSVILVLTVVTLMIGLWYAFLYDKTDEPKELEHSSADENIKDTYDFDIFKDLIVEYSGETKKITLDNSECSEFVKENVIFTIRYEKESYESGDVVEIIGYVDMNAAAENQYEIKSTTYKYIVE